MEIRHVGELITKCWVNAEEALRQSVRNKYHDRDEEMITDLFHADLEEQLGQASDAGHVSEAFGRDLEEAFPDHAVYELRAKIAQGLVATVAFHSRRTEGFTGGDLGLAFVRPDLEEHNFAGSQLSIVHDHRRGLLCQAKIFRRDSTWDDLTPAQKRNLKDRLAYSSLLLYRYIDPERRELMPFQWQLATGATVENLSDWLSSDSFPNPKGSAWILTALAQRKIGTGDETFITKYITPPTRSSLVIRVHWKHHDPGDTVLIQKKVKTSKQQHLVLYQ